MSRRRPTEPAANPARGIVLVVVAVLIGLFLLRNGIDTTVSTSGPTGSDGSGETTDGGTSTDSGTDGGTSSTIGLRLPGQVPTIVLNGSGVAGAAKKYSTALLNKGYTNLTNPDGANATNPADTTSVLYTAGFEGEAAAVALAIGAPSTSVAALGTTTPGTTSGASVIVVLGKDLGSTDPPA